MTKTFLVFGLISLLIVVLTSCSKKLYSSKNANKQNSVTTTANNSSYDTSDAFKGTITRNVVYASNAINYKGNQLQLTLDIYKPSNAE